MRLFVLGGAGEVGRHLTRDLLSQNVGDIIVADVDRSRAEALAYELSHSALEIEHVDLRDKQQLVELVTGSTVLINCAPFAWFDAVLDAAIDAGVNYADLISEPTESQRQRVAEAGLTAVSGLGLSPGTSNVLCAHAARDFDDLEELHIHWASFRSIAPSQGLLDTILWEMRNDCPTRQTYQNSKYVWSPPLDGGRTVRFPDPIGNQRVYVVPHTETITLPRHYPSLSTVSVRGTWRPDLMEDLLVLNKYGLLDGEPLDGPGTATAFAATRQRIWAKLGGARETWHRWALYLNVEAVARRGDEIVRREYSVWHEDWGTEAIGRMTGVNAAVGALLLARHGGKDGVGFVDPEVYFDPSEYLAELQLRDGMRVEWAESGVPQHPLERVA